MTGRDLAREVTPAQATVLDPIAGDDGPSGGIQIAMIDTGVKLSIVRNLRARGRHRRPCIPCHAGADALLATEPDAVFLANGPGDPGALDYIVQHRPRAGRQAARLRHLPRPPAAVPGGRPGDLQAALRPPRRQPPGQGPVHRPHRDHQPEPRLRGARPRRRAHHRRRRAGALGDRLRRRRAHPHQSLRPHRGGADPARRARAPPSSTTPRPGPGPTTRCTCSTASSTRSRRPPDVPRRDDIHKILLLGSGPIVIGQAAEFDYSGTQACRVLEQEGYEVVLVNSNPATIMTDPEVATTTYIEPLLPGPGGPGHRARAPRRAAADARRPDGAQPGQGAARGRHARALRRRADRRRLRRDRPRRGPRALPRHDDRRRPAGAALA